jgi:hypothetical protein
LFTFFAGTGIFAVAAVFQARHGIIVDGRTRTITVLHNRQLAFSVPFELAVATRVQLVGRDAGCALRSGRAAQVGSGRGNRAVDMDGPTELLAPILETVLNGALWRELEKFPPETLKRLLPRVDVPPNIRRLVEIWIEEKSRPAA